MKKNEEARLQAFRDCHLENSKFLEKYQVLLPQLLLGYFAIQKGVISDLYTFYLIVCMIFLAFSGSVFALLSIIVGREACEYPNDSKNFSPLYERAKNCELISLILNAVLYVLFIWFLLLKVHQSFNYTLAVYL